MELQNRVPAASLSRQIRLKATKSQPQQWAGRIIPYLPRPHDCSGQLLDDEACGNMSILAQEAMVCIEAAFRLRRARTDTKKRAAMIRLLKQMLLLNILLVPLMVFRITPERRAPTAPEAGQADPEEAIS